MKGKSRGIRVSGSRARGTKPGKAKNGGANKPRSGLFPVNSLAHKYASMLVDPCKAELDFAPYGETKLDFVTRRRAVSQSGTDPYCAYLWHPYYGVYAIGAATGSSAQPFAFNNGLSPFVDATVRTAKPIAGCLSFEWSGAESGRKGFLNASIVSGDNFVDSLLYGPSYTAFDINSLARICTHGERVPVDKFEINWVPGPRDVVPGTYVGNHFATTAADKVFWEEEWQGRNFVLLVVSGVTGVLGDFVLTCTSICEVAQSAGMNTTVNAATVSPPQINYAQVIKKLQDVDSGWYINAFKKATKFIAGSVGSYTGGGLPGLLGYLTMGSDNTVAAATRNMKS